MRIVIDMQGAQVEREQKAAENHAVLFLRALLAHAKDHEFYLVFNGDLPNLIQSVRDGFDGQIPRSQILLWHQPDLSSSHKSNINWTSSASELIREALILSLNPDAVLISSYFEERDDCSVRSVEWLNQVGIPIVFCDPLPLVPGDLSIWEVAAKKALGAMNAFVKPAASSQKEFRKRAENEVYLELLEKISTISRHEGNPYDSDLILCARAIAETFPRKPSLPRIFVDISELAQRDFKTGIQRVARSILYELLINPPAGYKIEPIYGKTDMVGYRLAKTFTRQLLNSSEPLGADEPIDAQAGDIFLGLDLQHHTTLVNSRYIESLRRRGVLVYFVVYDLLPIQFPQFWPPEDRVGEVHEDWLAVVCRGDGALCISKAVADELTDWAAKKLTRNANFKISWFHLGADIKGSLPTTGLPPDAPNILRTLLQRKTFLMVGTLEPRKGCAQVLDAFELLWAEGADINLVIVGKKGWIVEKLVNRLEKHTELGKRLFWLQGVSDEYLGKIYESSTCLIAASEGEGFGLPL
jgi:glycosyltransferase involved in cell wall biosynthesis